MSAKVLIVDDSKLARIVVGKTLTALQPDWTRVEAANADEACRARSRDDRRWRSSTSTCPARTAWSWPSTSASRYPDMPIAIATANVQDEIIARARAAKAHVRPQAGDRGRPARLPVAAPASSCDRPSQ